MDRNINLRIAKDVIRVRLCQMIINEKYKNGAFRIPIHLALGHEAIAVAVDKNMKDGDQLVLTHRNIHYNFARNKSLKRQLDEYLLKENGLAKGFLGSMNLANKERGLVYTSSILGNNLAVSAGLAMAHKVKNSKGIVFVVTGDGAIEEGSFYETMLFLKSNGLGVVIVVENNGWSLATKIDERRCSINLEKFAASFEIGYILLNGNDVYKYLNKIMEIREYVFKNKTPFCIEVNLSSLGGYYVKTNEHPVGRYVNYHAGPAPEISLNKWPVIEQSDNDPVYVLCKYFDENILKDIALEELQNMEENSR